MANNPFVSFPGPVTLVPPLRTRLGMFVGATGFTVAGVLLGFGMGLSFVVHVVGLFTMIFFGIVAMGHLANLIPGGSSLRLDRTGFEVTNAFRKRIYHWEQVSDFDLWAHGAAKKVIFRAITSRPSLLEAVNTFITRGRNGYLPYTYGMSADDLALTLTTWKNLALTENQYR